MNFMSSTNTNEKQVLSLKHVWQWDPEVVVKSFCRWGMLLVVNHHGAHISPPIILFAFYQCSLPQMCMRIKGSRKQHNEGEEGRERRDEGRERDGGGRWVAINPSSDDVRRGSREARQQQLQRERGGIQEKWWGSRTVRDNNADWSTAARRRKKRSKVIRVCEECDAPPAENTTHITRQTAASTFKTSSRCYFLQLPGVKLSRSLQSEDGIPSRCDLFSGETGTCEDV